MQVVSCCLEIVAALGCGVVSTVVVDYYSRIIQRVSNDWLRLAIGVGVGIPFIVLAPGAACIYLIGIGPLPADRTLRAFWILFVFFCWAAVLFGYFVRNRGTLKHRLGPPNI
jgi:hypothetical protein